MRRSLLAILLLLALAANLAIYRMARKYDHGGTVGSRHESVASLKTGDALPPSRWHQQTEDELWEGLAAALPSAPLDLMREVAARGKDSQDHLPACRRLPSPAGLAVANRHWQVLTFDFDVYIYSAHYDGRRRQEEEGRAAVRILGLVYK